MPCKIRVTSSPPSKKGGWGGLPNRRFYYSNIGLISYFQMLFTIATHNFGIKNNISNLKRLQNKPAT